MNAALFGDPTARRTIQVRRAWWADWAFPGLGDPALQVNDDVAIVRDADRVVSVPLRPWRADLVGRVGGWNGLELHIAAVRGGVIARVRWCRLGFPAVTALVLVEAAAG